MTLELHGTRLQTRYKSIEKVRKELSKPRRSSRGPAEEALPRPGSLCLMKKSKGTVESPNHTAVRGRVLFLTQPS
jgi:hypothetical protein